MTYFLWADKLTTCDAMNYPPPFINFLLRAVVISVTLKDVMACKFQYMKFLGCFSTLGRDPMWNHLEFKSGRQKCMFSIFFLFFFNYMTNWR